jgi:hypothetical protein
MSYKKGKTESSVHYGSCEGSGKKMEHTITMDPRQCVMMKEKGNQKEKNARKCCAQKVGHDGRLSVS